MMLHTLSAARSAIGQRPLRARVYNDREQELRLCGTRIVSGQTVSMLGVSLSCAPVVYESESAMRVGYLIDMDGVLYRGSQLIAGADHFVQQLLARDIPFRFLTNNSQRTRRDVVAKLSRMGIEVDEEHIFTCAMATARFLARQRPGGTAFVIGEGGTKTATRLLTTSLTTWLSAKDGTFNLELVESAVRMILGGAKLIATNLDPNCPTQNGLRPGCGALVAMLEAATGIKAFSVGKPSPVMMRTARKELGLATDETVMIGDTMDTDILGGVQLGFHTVLVLSGGTTLEDLPRYAYRPDLIVESLGSLAAKLDENDWQPPWTRQTAVPHAQAVFGFGEQFPTAMAAAAGR